MPDVNRSHMANHLDPNLVQPVTIIGAGSVGSAVLLMLAKLGVRQVVMYDGDAVESHNDPMALAFEPRHLGWKKVDVAGEIAKRYDVTFVGRPEMYTGQPLMAGAVICCVDSMEARACVWKQVHMNPNIGVFIDTRVHERQLDVYAVRPCEERDIELYETHLYPTSATPMRTCGKHGIVYVSAPAAATAVRALTDHWQGIQPALLEQCVYSDEGTRVFLTR